MMNVQNLGEFGLIERLRENLKSRAGLRVGIGDDAAVLDSLAHPVITLDALVENVHFRRDWMANRSSTKALGWKAMAVSVSDLAAMGAKPVAAFVALALPPETEISFVDELYRGFEDCAREFDFSIAGGDVTRAPIAMISVTLVGDLLPESNGEPVLRSGAQIGDLLCVTGTLGDSAAGLWLLQNAPETRNSNVEFALKRHFEPTPRLPEMCVLLESNRGIVHAALDLSDGIAGDAQHLARRSNVRLEIESAQLPISDATRELAAQHGFNAIELALAGGEDYELLLALDAASFSELQNAFPTPLTVVGRVVAGDANVVILQNGEPHANAKAWTHF